MPPIVGSVTHALGRGGEGGLDIHTTAWTVPAIKHNLQEKQFDAALTPILATASSGTLHLRHPQGVTLHENAEGSG